MNSQVEICGLKKFDFEQCSFKCSQKSKLKVHIQSIHEGVKYPCSQCEHKASGKSNLTAHIRSIHSGVKYEFSNIFCENLFSQFI